MKRADFSYADLDALNFGENASHALHLRLLNIATTDAPVLVHVVICFLYQWTVGHDRALHLFL